MADWIQWQTGFNGKLGYRVDTQPFSAVLFSCGSDLGICGAVLFRVESGKTAVMQKLVRQPTRAPANPCISKRMHQQTGQHQSATSEAG